MSNEPARTSNRLIARNSLLNLAGQLAPLFVGILSIPFVIRGLGVDGFGILSLAWMLLGYLTMFDLGLGRATTKLIAEELSNGVTERFQALFWTSTVMNSLLGICGGIAILAFAPVLAENVFRVPGELVGTAKQAFYLLAISLPIVLVSSSFRGSLEAAQRFELVNAVAVVSSSLTYLLPVVGIVLGFKVPGIIALLMIAKAGSASAYLMLCFKAFPSLRGRKAFDLKSLRQLMTFGGWMTISNALSPILVFFDRFFIASAISVAAVTYYTAPYEMITRLWILPVSLTMTLFPAFSSLGGSSKDALSILFARSVKYLLLLIGPLIMVLILFAGEIVKLWLGGDFALKSTIVFQILAAGVFCSSIAQVPYSLIQGLGRPDLTAKFHIVELLLYIPLVWLLVTSMGIAGGALAWTVRVALDCGLLLTASKRFTTVPFYVENGFVRGVMVFLPVALVLSAATIAEVTVFEKVAVSLGVLLPFAILTWQYVLAPEERKQLEFEAKRFMA